MLKIVLPVILFAAINSFGQTSALLPEVPLSKIAVFSSQPEALIQRQMTEIGVVRGMRVQSVVATDLFTGTRMKGARFEIQSPATTGTRDQRTVLLDPEDVDGLIRSAEFLKSNVLNTFPDSYTDVYFSTRDGVSIGAKFFDRQWHAALTLERSDANSTVALRLEDLNQLLDLLQQVKAKLKQ